ncbi:MAG: alpha amylase C-terminal domain-containing protein, partial [Muribaculaceae bacterium]|nr:alpha amylase C-terminal domain-containing protein [Muribaculaceae bacterium]
LPVRKLWDKDDDQVLAFMRGDLVFVFNFNPVQSFADYGFLAPEGEYHGVLDSDNPRYGGYGNIDEGVKHLTQPDPLYASALLGCLKLYLPARSAYILRLQPAKSKPEPKPAKATKTTKATKSRSKK